MLVVFPFCHRDLPAETALFGWIASFSDRFPNHSAMVLGSSGVDKDTVKRLADSIRHVFGKGVTGIRQAHSDERGWPLSCNTMFKTAVKAVQNQFPQPFFWCEPDCIPIKHDWLNQLDEEYKRVGKPFMGFVWDTPVRHMTGCGIYPFNPEVYNPTILSSDPLPWDVASPETTLPLTHHTNLIQHIGADHKTGKSTTFTKESLGILSPTAVVFHSNKDGSLISCLSGKPSIVRPKYYHSGNLGDITYALHAIKRHGGGSLVIGPKQNGTSPCAVPITRSQYQLLSPLLDLQPYITAHSFSDSLVEAEHDLNRFRDYWQDWKLRESNQIHNLSKMHFFAIGILKEWDEKNPWLLSPSISTGKVVIHRSSRYQQSPEMWIELVSRHRSRLLFVGLESEHSAFQRDFNCKVSYWNPVDFLELSAVIKGANAFVGNQSFPCSLAIGTGQKVWQESWKPSEDCIYNRKNFINQYHGIKEFEKWL